MRKRKFSVVILLGLMFLLNINMAFAANTAGSSSSGSSGSSGVGSGSFKLDDILSQSSGFFSGAISGSENEFLDLSGLITGITSMIFQIGNLVILVAMAVMGLRYVWSGVEGKTSVKESMINMSAGVIFFYMAQGVYEFAKGIVSGLVVKESFTAMQNDIWANVALVVKVGALIGLAAVGLKYMFTNADTKADIKRQLFPVALGLVIIFCMSNVLEFIINVAGESLGIKEGINQADVISESSGEIDENVRTATKNIFAAVSDIFQILAIAAIIFTGIRYMFASADTRADIKGQTIILLAGAILVFGGVEIIKAIQGIGNEALSGTGSSGGSGNRGYAIIEYLDENIQS